MNFREDNLRFAQQFRIVPDAFNAPVIVVELTPSSARRAGNLAAFIMAINLLPRTFETVYAVYPPTLPAGPHAWGLATLDEIVAEIGQTTEGALRAGAPERADISLSIGATGTVAATRTVLATGTAWRAAIDQPLTDGGDGVLGSLYAACAGSAQVLLHALEMARASYHPMSPFVFSLLDYADPSADAELPNGITLPEAHLVGVGAVGSALIYALGHFPHISGRLHLIDNDHVELRNLNRYILMLLSDLKRDKVDVAADALGRTAIQAEPHGVAFANYVGAHGSKIGLLLSPVDSEEGRRELARTLPRRVLNAATGGTTVTISSHGFGDGKACLHCLYMPPPNEATPEETMAKDMGLSSEEVKGIVRSNQPVDAALAARVEQHRGIAPGTYADKVGMPIHSFYQRAVCSDAELRLPTANVIAPLSFISAAAGVLLAAELIKLGHPALHRYSLDNYFRLDTLQVPNPAFHESRGADPSGKCICADPDYLAVYGDKYT